MTYVFATNRVILATNGVDIDALSAYIGRTETELDQMAYVIFDLDGTVICSQHRQLSKPDGSLDLAHWRENCTPENIAADKVLPLARAMRRMHEAGHTIIVLTARIMQDADFRFLANNDLPFHVALHRDACDERADAEMKVAHLEEYLTAHTGKGIRENNVVMFEDNLSVIDAMMKHDVMCFDANRANVKMERAA